MESDPISINTPPCYFINQGCDVLSSHPPKPHKEMLKILLFQTLLLLGYVEPMQETNDDREMYVIYMADGTVIEHAYMEEVIEWAETGTFEYNEALEIAVNYDEVKGN